VDVPVRGDVLHQVVLGVGHELLDRPVCLGRADALVGMEAFDPALGVLLRALDPVVRSRTPVVHVRIDDEVLLAILLIQGLTPPNTVSRSCCARPVPRSSVRYAPPRGTQGVVLPSPDSRGYGGRPPEPP